MNGLKNIASEIEGDIYTDELWQILYSTDASAYKERPIAVIRPRSKNDIQKVIGYATSLQIPIICRTAGTSLAGQVVGKGIILDFSKYFNHIIEINPDERWVKVEPGVIPDELNKTLKPFGLFFGPKTSSSNRCMLGGMVGNNASGAHSLIYGSTRDHLLEIKAILSDGSEVHFKPLNNREFDIKLQGNTLENKLYQNINQLLRSEINQKAIKKEFPDADIKRRNTGYAIDILLETDPFVNNGVPFNFSKLIAGSEGTLAIITEIKLNLVTLPPPVSGLLCVHLRTLEEALTANLIALKHHPDALELMDKAILDLARKSLGLKKNCAFIKDDPGAILIIELSGHSKTEIEEKAKNLADELIINKYGFHFPLVFGEDMKTIWDLRKSGLGVLSNLPGDAKPVSVIEDSCVRPEDLPAYIADLKLLLKKYDVDCVFHAHIGTGELHLRPVLNLKKNDDVKKFREIAFDFANLVKSYRGSLSGEHGDGRLRSEFIPMIIGKENYDIIRSIKKTWDPANILNPGKIINPVLMDSALRYFADQPIKNFITYFEYTEELGFIRALEKCNGSGDCRKTEVTGGVMCPSYMATRDENHSTRGRANILRELISHSIKKNPFNHHEIRAVLDLCLSCKGCKTECPSGVDMTKYKAEFYQHWFLSHPVPLKTLAVAYMNEIYSIASLIPAFSNRILSHPLTSGILKKIAGFTHKRPLPKLSEKSLKNWAAHHPDELIAKGIPIGKVFLFADEFTNYSELHLGISTIKLLTTLGYHVEIPLHKQSGRAMLSKGLLVKARKIAGKNIELLAPLISDETPLLGIEPSAILCFRDEYPALLKGQRKKLAEQIKNHCLMIDEFIDREVYRNKVSKDQFKDTDVKIRLHGHCHQRSIASISPTINMLNLIKGIQLEVIPSGCCGMAGSFGYEKEHYDISMKIGELVLFPSVRQADENEIIMAPGTSCRAQILQGTGRQAIHPVEFMVQMLKNDKV